MSKKVTFLLLVATIFALPLMGAEHEIQLRKGGTQTGSRTENIVSASLNEQELTVSFSDITASSILVYDATDTLLFSQSYAPAYSAQLDLTALPTGDYVVEVYAFDEWWMGDFVIE